MISQFLILCLCCVTVSFGQGSNFTVIVDVPELGPIEGNEAATARDQRQYWVFHGIPYANKASYTGERRFQPSELHTEPLTEDGSPFKANLIRVFCPQNEIIELPGNDTNDLAAVLTSAEKTRRHVKNFIRNAKSVDEIRANTPIWGQEDCLTININTPKIPTGGDDDTLLPVILFFHGGGSDSIFGSVFTGLRLMEKDVVLLTVNYRLGVLGALNLGINEAPGCGALYDAVTALKWIQRYVQYFGGDPNRVTITGQSAGSMMVTHLMLSPLARGLFHGAWGFSGATLNVWATAVHPSISHHLDMSYHAGCYDRETGTPSDPKEIAACMNTKTIEELVAAQNMYMHQETSAGRLGFDGKSPASIQSPTITAHPLFLAEEPLKILKEGRQAPVPLVLGATRHDGSYPLDDLYLDYLLPSGKLDDPEYVRNDMLREMLETMRIKDESGGLFHSMSKEYFGDAANSGNFDDKIPGMIDITTVIGFKAGEYKTIELHSKIQPKSYFYSFDYDGRWTIYNLMWGIDKKIPGGICHTDDLIYMFYFFPLFNDDMKVSRRYVDYFVNFATYGDPNGDGQEHGQNEENGYVNWPVYNGIDHPFVVINRVDKVQYQCPDSWIGASLELMPPQNN
jgi:carboxylesterase type B